MRLSRPLAGLATVAVLAALSGCGVAEAGINPGVAASVDDAEVSLDQVEDSYADTCEVLQGSADLLQGGFTGAELRGIVVQQVRCCVGVWACVGVRACAARFFCFAWAFWGEEGLPARARRRRKRKHALDTPTC